MHTDVNFVLLQKLMKFPHHQLFPVLDLCRMMALDVSMQGRLAAMAADLNSKSPGEPQIGQIDVGSKPVAWEYKKLETIDLAHLELS